MQQPREPELNFSQVKKDLNLVDLVLTLGYQHNRVKSGADLDKEKFHTFDYKGQPGLDQVIIYKSQQGDYLYFNRADDRDRGDVISFLKNRLENPRISGLAAVPGKSIWASVIENAKRFLSLPAPERQHSNQLQQRMEPRKPGEAYVPDFLRKTTPLTDTRYLNSRGLTDETLTSPFFAGRILNHVHEGTGHDGRSYRYVNTAFPQIYKDGIVGLEIKASGSKGQADNSLTSSALWLSKPTTKTNTLIISESAIDSLSHYQLKQPTNALYASTSGQLTDNKVSEIRRLVENNALRTVKLAMDNNLEGHLFDTKLITGLARLATPMRIDRILPGLVTVDIYSQQDEPVIKLNREVKAYNQQLTEEFRKVAGQEPATSAALDAELIKAAKMGENSYQFHIPKRCGAISLFNQALLASFPMMVKVELEKSKAKDWNDQLKKSRSVSDQIDQSSDIVVRTQVPAKESKHAPSPRRGPKV